jgi:hypothetical protein
VINPITLANRTSIHPKAMKYKRKVMRLLVPVLRQSLFLFHHSACQPVVTSSSAWAALSLSRTREPDQKIDVLHNRAAETPQNWASFGIGTIDFNAIR